MPTLLLYLLGKVMVVLLSVLPSQSTSFFFHHHTRQHFHYSRILPDGEEMKVYCYKETSVMLFFPVEDHEAILELAVTPCASPLTWQLSRKPLPPSSKEGPAGSDPFLEQTMSVQLNWQASLTLGNWSGEDRMVYREESASPGLYILLITSLQSDSIVHIVASTTGQAVNVLYPVLPSVPKVNVTHVGRHTITFQWPQAGSMNREWVVEYCVSVSTVKHFRTHCAVISHAEGDPKPTFTEDDQWGFSWEKGQIQDMRKNANPVKAMSPRKIFHQCVGSKNEFTYRKARRGKVYYLDVFVMDNMTNRASAYQGVSVRVPTSSTSGTKRKVQIQDGDRITLKLRQEDSPQSVMFQAKHDMSNLALEIQVCAGKLPFEIYYENRLIHKSTATRWKRVRMKHVMSGQYILKFPRPQRRKSYVSIYMTSQPSRLALPIDMSIKVFDMLTSCHNLTVAWRGTNRKQKYCLYYKEASQVRSLKQHKCTHMGQRPSSERVMCTSYRNSDLSKSVLTASVTGLKANTHYVLDVYLSKRYSGPVAYKTVGVKTKAIC